MVIEIPDNIFESELRQTFEKMSPVANKNKSNPRYTSPVMHRIAKEIRTGTEMGITVISFYRTIKRELIRRKIIVYNPDTDTWQGAEYHGN